MTDLSETEEANVLNNIAAGGVYVGLHTADEGQEPDGSNEVSASDYSRAVIAESDLTVSGASPTTLTNDLAVSFTDSANENWGDVSHAVLWDDTIANSGEPYTAAIAVSGGGTVETGVGVDIPSGELTVDMD